MVLTKLQDEIQSIHDSNLYTIYENNYIIYFYNTMRINKLINEIHNVLT